VIESGFGSLDAFNMLVSGLFDQREVRTSVRRPSQVEVSCRPSQLFDTMGTAAQSALRRNSFTRRWSKDARALAPAPAEPSVRSTV